MARHWSVRNDAAFPESVTVRSGSAGLRAPVLFLLVAGCTPWMHLSIRPSRAIFQPA